MEMVDQLRSLLDRTLALSGRGLGQKADAQLLGALPELDSVGVISVITAMEERFGITVEDDEISADTFSTLNSMAEYVNSKLGVSS